MKQGMFQAGYTVGNGAAINVELGWIPDVVRVVNLTDGDLDTEAFLGGGREIVPFSSGGTTEIAAGDLITGATTGATARIREVLVYSGTWAAGTAAGFFVVEMVGTTDFGSENVDTDNGSNLATVTVNVTHAIATSTAVAAVTGNAALSPYAGSTTAAKGFTIGSTVAEEAKLLAWYAFARDL